MSNLQLWNTSRSIAADALDVVLDNTDNHGVAPTRHDVVVSFAEEDYEQQASEHDYWPFNDVDDLINLTERVADFKRDREHIDALAEEIKQRLRENASETTDDASSEVEGDAEINTGTDATTDADTDSDSRDVEFNTGQNKDNVTRQIATDLYYSFLGDENTSLPDIKAQYDTEFPDRSVILTEIMNTTGSSEERIRKIESWVRDWYDDAEKVEQVNKWARSPMGASGV